MSTALFQPIQLGDLQLKHRVVFSPSTRLRANTKHVQPPITVTYYSQRASTPGTLLITEATVIAARATGYPNGPGIWTKEQIESWKKVVDAVHAKGSFIYLQMYAFGRAAHPHDVEHEDPSLPYVSASDVGLKDPSYGGAKPRPLTVTEIKEYVDLYGVAASNAVHKAGFDGVEIHGANGYLLDQFIQDVTNKRTDEYGGSIENRVRFPFEVIDSVVKAIGEEKTSYRISPWSTFQEMRMADPKPTYSYFVQQLKDRYPKLSYLHIVEPRADGMDSVDKVPLTDSNEFIREIWGERRLISAGGYTRSTAIQTAAKKGDLIAFGRRFIANPDLPQRLIRDIPLNTGDRATYYSPGSLDPKGYTDYPFASSLVGELSSLVAELRL